MHRADWQRWDRPGVAEAVDGYWETSAHELAHREGLADLTAHCLASPGSRVLDLGCGTATLYRRLVPARLARAGYVGVDGSPRMLALARARAPAACLILGDAYELPFAARAFDVVVCFEVLGHLPDIGPPIREALRVSADVTVFTVWPSGGQDIIDDRETVAEVAFLHRRYSDGYVRAVVREAMAGDAHRVQLAVLSSECWAYIVRRGRHAGPRNRHQIVPVHGYERRLRRLADERVSQLTRSHAAALEAVEKMYGRLAEQLAESRGREMALQRQAGELQVAVATAERELAEARRRQSEVEHARRESERDWLAAQRELGPLRAQVEALRRDSQNALHEAERGRAAAEGDLTRLRSRSQALAAEVAAFRRRRLVRWTSWMRPLHDFRHDISPAFQQLLDDSLLFGRDLAGFRLHPSPYLDGRPRVYPLTSPRPSLSGILLAVLPEGPSTAGVVVAEIVSGAVVVARTSISLADVDPDAPTLFRHGLVPQPAGSRLILRVAAEGADVPVRLFEWRRGGPLGPLTPSTRPFCGFVFD